MSRGFCSGSVGCTTRAGDGMGCAVRCTPEGHESGTVSELDAMVHMMPSL